MRMKWLWVSSVLYWIALYATFSTISVQAERAAQFALFGVGIMLGFFGAGLLLARIPIGLLATRINRKLLFFVGLCVVLAGNIIVPVASPNPIALFPSRFLLGVGAGFWILSSVMFVEHHDDKPKATSRITLTYALGITIGGLGGGILANIGDWNTPFWAGTIAAALAIATLLPVRDMVEPPAPLSLREFFQLSRQPQLLMVSALGALMFFVLTATVLGFTQNFAARLGANPLWLGIVYFAMLAPYSLTISIAHRVRSRIGADFTLALGFVAGGIATMFVPFAGSVVILSLLQAVVGAGLGLVYSSLMWLAIKDTNHKNESMGVFQTIYALGFLMGPVLTGRVVGTTSLEAGFFLNGSLALAAFAAIAALTLLRGFSVRFRRFPRLE
ncbi:MAG: MFS transporter [Candidatus Wildermuthbacteria bacterium]|nr:MFS transporter [Candidatus Wildermuthbacteria bacterium]